MEDSTRKNINKEIQKIQYFFTSSEFEVLCSNFPIHQSNIVLTKDVAHSNIDFNLVLKDSVHPTNISFKKLGFNENFTIQSGKENFIVPPRGVTNITGKRFVSTNEVKGKISSIFTQTFPFGYFGVTVPPISVKQCHFERYCNNIKNNLFAL